jgi:SAM-dependent methyltransferase
MSDGFVFKDKAGGGLEFIGDFEGLYKQSEDPWGQGGSREDMAAYYEFSRQRLATSVLAHTAGSPFRGVEVGCGHGYVTEHLRKTVGGDWIGIDISNTAVRKARELHPHCKFYTSDIRGALPFPPSEIGAFDVVVLSQTLWYVLDRLDDAVRNAVRMVKLDGLFIVSQAFLRNQLYGNEVICGFSGAVRYFSDKHPNLRLVEAAYDDTEEFVHHDGLLIYRKIFHAY